MGAAGTLLALAPFAGWGKLFPKARAEHPDGTIPVSSTNAAQATDKTAIRPFHVNVPEAELAELRRRIKATRWPERETTKDFSQGVQLAMIQELARYWATDYDWRTVEAKL